jgi:hypothetical protein
MALVTCVAILASLPIPMWTATRAMLAIQSQHPALQWTAIVVAYIFSAILPLFYFALSRNAGALRLSKRRRLASLAGALAGLIVMAAGLPQWLESSRPHLTTIKMLLSDLATFACVALLIAFFRQTPDAHAPTSGFVSVIAGVAIIAGGLWLAFNLLALIVTPGTGVIRTLLEQACLFTAPCVVYRTGLRQG